MKRRKLTRYPHRIYALAFGDRVHICHNNEERGALVEEMFVYVIGINPDKTIDVVATTDTGRVYYRNRSVRSRVRHVKEDS